MRGSRVALPLIAAALLAFPAATALLALEPAGQDAGASLGAAGITWFGPERVQVGHPVHAAVAVLTGDGYGTEMHQNLAVHVTLNDAPLLITPSIHEHHGLHVLTVTPMQPGTLRLWAGEPGDAHEHLALLAAGVGGAEPAGGATHEVVVAGTPLAVADLVRLDPRAGHDAAVSAWSLETTARDVPFTALMTLSDAEGRLLASAWARGEDGAAVQHADSAQIQRAEMLLMPHPAANVTPYAESVATPPDGTGPVVSLQLPEVAPPTLCGDGERRLVLDPDSLVPGMPAWQEWSDVRAHLLDPARLAEPDPAPLTYEIWPLPLLTPQGATYTLEATDPFGFASFRVTQVGPHLMVVRDEHGTALCHAPFMVLPGPGVVAATPGSLDVRLEETGSGADVLLQSLDADGGALPHYEFDVRIVRQADEAGPGFLAWRGKLHGHGGEVEFTIDNLPRGSYEMRVYPSPQDAELPPLAGGGDGFVTVFTVSEGPGYETTDGPDPNMDVPALPVVFLFAVALALGALLRRRAQSG